MSGKIKITQVKSTIGEKSSIRSVVKSMGLRKIGHTKEYKDTNCIRGMVNKINHLVKYELI